MTMILGGTNPAVTFPDGTIQNSANNNFAGPAFSAYQSVSQTGIASGTATKVTFTTKEFDTNSNYDTTLSRFTPTIAGYYQVNSGLAWLTGAGSSAIINIYKNGTDYKDGNSGIGGSYRSAVNALVYCNGSTDYLEIYAVQNSGIAQSVAAAINYTYFQAAMVRVA